MQTEGSGRREVVTRLAAKQSGRVGEVAWSPAGKALAYDRLGILTPGAPPERVSSLWRVNTDGSGAIELANAGVPSRDGIIVAGWSPDGSHVLYRINDYFSGSFLADGTTLWSVPASGGTAVQIGGNLASAARPSIDRVLYYGDFLAWPHSEGAASNELAVTFGSYRSTDLPIDSQTTWFGYYGHIDWQSKFDWWRGPARSSTPAPSPAPAWR